MKHMQKKVTKTTKNHRLYDDHHSPDCQFCGGLLLGTFYCERHISLRNAAYALNGQFGHLCLIYTRLGNFVFYKNSPIVKPPHKQIPVCGDRHTKGEFLLSAQLLWMYVSLKPLSQIFDEHHSYTEFHESKFPRYLQFSRSQNLHSHFCLQKSARNEKDCFEGLPCEYKIRQAVHKHLFLTGTSLLYICFAFRP